mmetsp:Transcript_114244/g.295812  ORF Transcript_114244/g.295812 Transcript_114244/m.295812 type:complete len:355 (-) Transcript_114244:895-1959(-)
MAGDATPLAAVMPPDVRGIGGNARSREVSGAMQWPPPLPPKAGEGCCNAVWVLLVSAPLVVGLSRFVNGAGEGRNGLVNLGDRSGGGAVFAPPLGDTAEAEAAEEGAEEEAPGEEAMPDGGVAFGVEGLNSWEKPTAASAAGAVAAAFGSALPSMYGSGPATPALLTFLKCGPSAMHLSAMKSKSRTSFSNTEQLSRSSALSFFGRRCRSWNSKSVLLFASFARGSHLLGELPPAPSSFSHTGSAGPKSRKPRARRCNGKALSSSSFNLANLCVRCSSSSSSSSCSPSLTAVLIDDKQQSVVKCDGKGESTDKVSPQSPGPPSLLDFTTARRASPAHSSIARPASRTASRMHRP